MPRVVFLACRWISAAIFLLTWAFGLTVSIPFAFDQFVRPQLFPWLTQFVTWHHAWYWVALLSSAVTLLPDLAAARREPSRRAAGVLAAAYLMVFGAVGVYLLGEPFLATLGTGSRNPWVVPGALLPLLWLALIDHVAVAFPSGANLSEGAITGQRRLLAACTGAALTLWLIHIVGSALRADLSADFVGWTVAATWALVLDLTLFAIAFGVISLGTAIAAGRKRPFTWEYAFAVTFIAIGVTEFLRRIVLPAFSFGADAAVVSLPLGVVLAAMWSGWTLRRLNGREVTEPALVTIWPMARVRPPLSFGLACAIAGTAALSFSAVEQIDWALVLNRLIAVTEATLFFGLFLGWLRSGQSGRWSLLTLIGPPFALLLVLHGLPFLAGALVTATGDGRYDTQAALDRLPAADALAGLAGRQLIEQPALDGSYFRKILSSESTQSALRPAVPAMVPAPAMATTPPHVFIFVIDSLRRDYLSPYNPAVTFTPAIDAFAADSYIYRNAFAMYGGTWLSIPSMWTGSPLTRGWSSIFARVNLLEPLITAGQYDFVINDYTVNESFKPTTAMTFLDPEIQSVQTDLCRSVKTLETHIDGNRSGGRPLFVFLAPMNVHILNTRSKAAGEGRTYQGFYEPYAERLRRLDECFGQFVGYLKQRGFYDNSIILLTGDHGDSLGKDGQWGHQFFLFPEDIRVPMIIHLPPEQRRTLTTDLARVTLLPDIGPTLVALVSSPPPDAGAPFGAPLFVPRDRELRPRRRESFLLMSSYGSTYASLRRNGRFLFISDLMNWREYAYTLFREPLGEPVPVTDALRRVNREVIQNRVAEVETLYRAK